MLVIPTQATTLMFDVDYRDELRGINVVVFSIHTSPIPPRNQIPDNDDGVGISLDPVGGRHSALATLPWASSSVFVDTK